MPYRTAPPAAPVAYRHPLRGRVRRLWWRVCAYFAPRLVRRQCWACLRTHGTTRGGSGFCQCDGPAYSRCLDDIHAWVASGYKVRPERGYLMPRAR
jgi:hypothetical protein